MQNLLDGQNNEYDVLDEPKDNKKLLFVVFIVAILAAVAFSVYYFVTASPVIIAENKQNLQNIPLLKPAGPLKKIPDNPGGLNIPHQDKQVFQTIEEPSPSEESSEPVSEAAPEATGQLQEQEEVAETATVLPAPEVLIVPEPSPPSQPSQPSESPVVADDGGADDNSVIGRKLEIIIPPAPEPVSEAAPEPASEPASANDDKLEIALPATEPSPPVTEAPEPVGEAAPEPASEPASANDDKLEIALPATEPSPEPAPDPVSDAAGEPVSPQPSQQQSENFSVQFAAFDNVNSAEVVSKDLSIRFADILSSYGLTDRLIVKSAESSSGSEIFRVQIIDLNYDIAQDICEKVKQENLDCFVKSEK